MVPGLQRAAMTRDSQAEGRGRSRWALLGLMSYWGYVTGINSAIAPFLARSFDLDDLGIGALKPLGGVRDRAIG